MEALALSTSNVGVMVMSRSATTILKSHVIHLKMITVAKPRSCPPRGAMCYSGKLCVLISVPSSY